MLQRSSTFMMLTLAIVLSTFWVAARASAQPRITFLSDGPQPSTISHLAGGVLEIGAYYPGPHPGPELPLASRRRASAR